MCRVLIWRVRERSARETHHGGEDEPPHGHIQLVKVADGFGVLVFFSLLLDISNFLGQLLQVVLVVSILKLELCYTR